MAAEARLGPAFSPRAGRREFSPAIHHHPGMDPSLENALGLVEDGQWPRWPRPSPGVGFALAPSAAAVSLLESAAEFSQTLLPDRRIDLHRTRDLEELLRPWTAPRGESARPRIPWRESEWLAWLEERPDDTRDADGLELVRLMLGGEEGVEAGPSSAGNTSVWSYHEQVTAGAIAWSLVPHFLRAVAPEGAGELAVLAIESAAATMSQDALAALAGPEANGGEAEPRFSSAKDEIHAVAARIGRARDVLGVLRVQQQGDVARRVLGALSWLDQESRSYDHLGLRIQSDDFIAGVAAGAFENDGAARAELLRHMIGPGVPRRPGHRFFGSVTVARPQPGLSLLYDPLDAFPDLQAARDQAVARVIEIELDQNIAPTVTAPFVLQLGRLHGLAPLRSALDSLEEAPIEPERAAFGYWADKRPRNERISALILSTAPDDGHHDDFLGWSRSQSPDRLRELAVHNPHWAHHVEVALGVPGLADAVHWLRVHGQHRDELDDVALLALRAEAAARTPVDVEELLDGGLDVAWLNRVLASCGLAELERLLDRANKAITRSVRNRLGPLLQAANGGANERDLLAEVDSTRSRNAISAVGVVPLPPEEDREECIRRRLSRFDRFEAEADSSPKGRRRAEQRAAMIARENLARAAGFRDHDHLSWWLDSDANGDLGDGPVEVTSGDLVARLSVGPAGSPRLEISRAGRTLKNLPRGAKGDPGVASLVARAKLIERSTSTMAARLEAWMVERHAVGTDQLARISSNPAQGVLLHGLVWIADKSACAGRPSKDWDALVSVDGTRRTISRDTLLRIAHPCDLHALGVLSDWQLSMLADERGQPFEQLLRQLHLADDESARGVQDSVPEQVPDSEALDALERFGWVRTGYTTCDRTFHAHGVIARFDLTSAAEQERSGPITFRSMTEGRNMRARSVAPIAFSEAVRDVRRTVVAAPPS